MLVVEMIAKIRRDYLVEGKSIKAIARDRGISRDTVRKVLRSGGAGTAKQLQSLLSQIIKRIMKALTRHGALIG
jgi:DNA invertase Pin-like site-specific DNA recombinase